MADISKYAKELGRIVEALSSMDRILQTPIPDLETATANKKRLLEYTNKARTDAAALLVLAWKPVNNDRAKPPLT